MAGEVDVVISRVLVVTDDDAVSIAARDAFAPFGAALHLARSRRELAVQIARGAPFDFVLSEMVTPWMTGTDVLRACERRDEVPILFVAPVGSPFTPADVEHLGPLARLMRRPFVARDLEIAIAKLCDRRR